MKKILLPLLLITGMVQAADFAPAVQSRVEINIEGLDKKVLLQALFEGAKHQEGDFPAGIPLIPLCQQPNTLDDAELEGNLTRGYIEEIVSKYGLTKHMYMDLSGDIVDVYQYNELNGEGLAEQAIEELREALRGTKSAEKH